MTDATNARRFAIALSFPGEHRRFVKNVADRLAEVLGKNRVFYDEWYEAELIGLDGDLKLRRYYRDESEMVVPFFSEHYEKDWCQIEWSAIRAMLKTRRKENAVIPVQLDGTRIEGWEEIDFAIRKRSRSARQIADLIIEAYRLRFPVSVASQEGRRSAETSGLPASVRTLPRSPTISDRIPVDITRLVKYAPTELIGRESETKLLNDAWGKVQRQEAKRMQILTFVALGGEGKTSLVAKWAADLAYQNWPGCEAAFAWSFYSQGTRDQAAASSDLFLKEALNFFGNDDDKQFAASNAGAYEKGQRLARVVGQRRALLILDGLEPLQYAPTSPTPGELKDQGIAALLKGLAANSHGLCVVTTRYALPDLRAFIGKTVHEEKLTRLSIDAGVALLQSLGVKGSLRKSIPSTDGRTLWNEYEKLVEDVKGHALTLNLLGTYLRDAHAGDIRQRDLIKLEEADAEEQSGHAFHVMDAYVQSFESGGKTEENQIKGRRALALLQLLGLFDRPAPADLLNVLWQAPAIDGLTEPLIGLSEAQRNLSLKRLEDAKLLTVNRAKGSGELIALDAHPLLREYFARRVRQQQPEAWRAAHRRLYEYLCATTNEGDEPTLEDLQPLYQAVAHGCQAGLQREAFDDVFFTRIERGREAYSTKRLGAFGLGSRRLLL
jgi:hypothetical protein